MTRSCSANGLTLAPVVRPPMVRFHRLASCLGIASWLSITAYGCLLILSAPSSVVAQNKGAATETLPTTQLLALFPAGGKQGSTVEVKLTNGTDLERVDRLLFSHPEIKAEQKKEPPKYGGAPEPVANTFIVTVGAKVPPGLYDVRAVGYFGISNPRTFVVGTADELNESADNNTFAKAAPIALGAIINGQAAATTADYFKVQAKQGQRVLVDVMAQRIDSKMDATLVAYDSTGRELALNRNTNRRDPLLDFTAPADGEYVIAVYDFLYEGGNDYFYRLRAHTDPYIDFVYPPVGQPGTKGSFTIYGRNLPGGKPAAKLSVGGRPLEQLSVTIDVPTGDAATKLEPAPWASSQQAMLDGFAYQLTGPQGVSNAFLIGFAAAPVIVEREPNQTAAQAQEIAVPCEFVGQFDRRGDEDFLTFNAKKGDIFSIEVTSQRLQLPTDPEAVLQRVTKDDKGEVKVSDVSVIDDEAKDLGGPSFPTASGDAAYRLQVNEDSTYRLIVRDQHGAVGDPRRIYRISIRKPTPDFRLAAVSSYPTLAKDAKPWALCVRRGGSVSFDLVAFRKDGFDGEIEVTAEGLPKGVTASTVVLGAEQEAVPLVITAAADAAGWVGAIKIVGKAKINNQNVTRPARAGVTAWPGLLGQNNQPGRPAEGRLARELVLSVHDGESVPVAIELADGKPVETSRAGKVEVPIKVIRRDGFKEAVTVTAYGLPTAYKTQNVTIAAGANDGKLAIELPVNAVPGSLSFNVRGAAKVSYKRDPVGAEAAANFKKQMEKLAADLDKESKAADKAKQETDAAAKAAQAALQKATDANRAELQQKATDTEAAKQKALTAAADLAAKLKAANDAKTAADKKATDMANAAKPKDMNLVIASTMGKLLVGPAPMTFDKPAAASVKKGDKAESTIAVTRLYGYADPIDIEFVLPANLKQVKLSAPAIAKGKNDTKIAIAAEKDAPPGSYAVVVRAKPKLNGQTLTVDQEITLKVE